MEMELPLPEDVLANILDRLRPRDLAHSRRVCRSWHGVVDARCLLLRRALPHSVHGFFLNYIDYNRQHFLARPSSAGPHIDGRLSFLPSDDSEWSWSAVRDHHNGLILYTRHYEDTELLVLNPATRQWAALPPLVEALTWAGYIVYEPAMSPHYEVFLIPPLPKGDAEMDYRLMEWPPSSCVLQVFSSKTGRWEERNFAREGEAAGFVADLRRETNPLRHLWRHAMRLQGTLYVQCRGAYVMRLSLHDQKYQVIKTPINITACAKARSYLGSSQNQVCFATVQELEQLTVWNLGESFGCTNWVLKHQVNVALSYHYPFRKKYHSDGVNKQWILEDEHTNNDLLGDDQYGEEEGGFSGSLFDSCSDEKDTNKEIVEEIIEWNSDDDNVLFINDMNEGYIRHISILGFHPYKEVIFLADSFRGIAYHMNTSKFQFLGFLRPKSYTYSHFANVERSFLFTPCMIGEFPKQSCTLE